MLSGIEVSPKLKYHIYTLIQLQVFIIHKWLPGSLVQKKIVDFNLHSCITGHMQHIKLRIGFELWLANESVAFLNLDQHHPEFTWKCHFPNCNYSDTIRNKLNHHITMKHARGKYVNIHVFSSANCPTPLSVHSAILAMCVAKYIRLRSLCRIICSS